MRITVAAPAKTGPKSSPTTRAAGPSSRRRRSRCQGSLGRLSSFSLPLFRLEAVEPCAPVGPLLGCLAAAAGAAPCGADGCPDRIEPASRRRTSAAAPHRPGPLPQGIEARSASGAHRQKPRGLIVAAVARRNQSRRVMACPRIAQEPLDPAHTGHRQDGRRRLPRRLRCLRTNGSGPRQRLGWGV